MRFLKGLVITVLFFGTIIAIGFILDATIPAVHDFFVSFFDWFKELFNITEEVVEDTSEIVEAIKD